MAVEQFRLDTLQHVKMNPLWIWAQGIIVVGTVAGMIIALTKLL